MHVAVFSTQSYDREYFDRANDGQHELSYLKTSLEKDTVALARDAEAVCVFVNDDLSAGVIAQLAEQGVRLIALRCAGFNNVDLEAAEDHGIRVVRVPAYSPEAIAEHALALILTLNRKTHKAYNRVREGNFSLERMVGFNLYGKTIGVIGTGRIGRAFCTLLQGFGCIVLGYDKFPNADVPVKYVKLDELYRRSDIVSLHCPLNEETHHLIDEAALEKMKDGAMLINTSRGGLVKTKAAIHALKHRKLGYLGLDVYEQEEALFFQDHSESIIPDDMIARLMSFPNVLVTAHQGFFTAEALTQIAETTIDNISAFASDGPLTNEVKAEGHAA